MRALFFFCLYVLVYYKKNIYLEGENAVKENFPLFRNYYSSLTPSSSSSTKKNEETFFTLFFDNGKWLVLGSFITLVSFQCFPLINVPLLKIGFRHLSVRLKRVAFIQCLEGAHLFIICLTLILRSHSWNQPYSAHGFLQKWAKIWICGISKTIEAIDFN